MLAAVLLQKRFVSCTNLQKKLKKSGINVFCRTCLSTLDLQPLFRCRTEDAEMSYKLNIVTGLKIQKEDELSQSICKTCLDTIDFSLQFRFRSKQAEETLRQMLNDSTNKETSPVLKPSKIYPFYDINTNDETDPDPNKTSEQVLDKLPIEVKIENCTELYTHNFQNDRNDDQFDYNDIDSEDDLKPLIVLKTELKTEPVAATEPIVTITKTSKSDKNDAKHVNYSAKLKTRVNNVRKKRKKQDRMNKISTFIKVDNLPADWFGFIKPNVKENNKKLPKVPKEIEKEKKDPVTKEDVPVFIKVENLPEDMDKVPMPKVPRPHRRIEVPDGPPYKCSICEKQYMKRPMYLAHVRFHTHYHICEQCGKQCKNRSLLSTHQRAVHGLTKIHKCSQCDYSATTKCALIVHERRHKDERPFVCDHCGAAFYTRRTLAQHIGVHMPANIQCPHCPKKCKSMKLLSNHRARKHARRYIYHCPVCPKQFRENNAVHKHLSGYHGMPRDQHPTIAKQLVA